MKRRLLMWILWPAFLCAALAELVVFAVVNPACLLYTSPSPRDHG